MLMSLKRISFENFTKDDGVVMELAHRFTTTTRPTTRLRTTRFHIKKNAIELIETHKPSASKRIKELFEELDTAELLINTASHADFKAHHMHNCSKCFAERIIISAHRPTRDISKAP